MEKLLKPIMFIMGAIFVLSIITKVSVDKIDCGWLFCYEETNRNPSQRLGCQCELFIVCVYFFYAIYGRHLPDCPSSYLLPCRNYAGPS